MSYADGRDILNQEDHDFLSHHISGGTRGNYGRAWIHFCKFCAELNVDPETCSPAVLVKYVRDQFETGASYSSVNIARSAVSKFHHGVPGLGPVG